MNRECNNKLKLSIVDFKRLPCKQNDTNGAISKRWDYLTCPPLGASCGMICETSILLVIETTWTFDVAFCFPGCCIMCFSDSTAGQGFLRMES